VIENPNPTVASVYARAASRAGRSATALLECEKSSRRIMGHRHLWTLDQKLEALTEGPGLAAEVRGRVVVMGRLYPSTALGATPTLTPRWRNANCPLTQRNLPFAPHHPR